MKKRVNISLDEDTVKRLKTLAAESHMNVSQWISQVVWKTEIPNNESKEEAKYGCNS